MKIRSGFDIGLLDLEGRYHSVQEDAISAIEEEKESLMRPVAATADELQNLIAYLGPPDWCEARHTRCGGNVRRAGDRLLTDRGSPARRLAHL